MDDHKLSALQAIEHARRRPEGDPGIDQTADTISAHYRKAEFGDPAAIRETYGGFLSFRVTKVEAIKGPRIYLEEGAGFGGVAFYLKSGKNCQSPTGQAHLVIPTQAVLDFAAENPRGKSVGGSLTNFPYDEQFSFSNRNKR